jgi:hypothetical protein
LATIGPSKESFQEAGSQADAGSFVCVDCSFPLSIDHAEELPACPNCGASSFKRASLFEQPTLGHLRPVSPSREPEGWLDALRESLDPGKYLAFYIEGRARAVALSVGWSRIGRSGSADIRLDDPTVSRRHAVIVHTPEGELRVLDDRSMNGIMVNGDGVDWSPLCDGDTVQVGRYSLHVLETGGAKAD